MRSWARYSIGPLALLFAGLPAAGQSLIQFSRPGATVGTTYDGEWIRTDESFGLARAREWAEVQLAGAFGRSPVLDLSLSVRPYIGQGWARPSAEGVDLDEDGLTGHASLRLFPARSINVNASGSRYSRFLPDAFGGFGQSDGWSWSTELRDGNPLLPVSLSYSDQQETRVQQSGLTQRTLTVDRRVRDIRYQAHNWKTKLFFRYLDVDGLVNSLPQGRVEKRGRAVNNLRWGKGSRLHTQVRYLHRERETTSRSLSVGTRALLQHTGTLSSEYEWLGERRSFGEGWSGREGMLRARVNLRRSGYSGSIGFRRTTSKMGGNHRTQTRLGPQITVAHRFAPRVSLNADAQGGYTWNRQVDQGSAYAYVLEERHIFGVDGRIQLENPFVDQASLTLQSVNSGTRYDEGFDYRIQDEGPFLVVLALPGGRITEGTEVVADYRFQTTPDVSTEAFDLRGSLTLRAGGLSLLYRRRIRNDLDDLRTATFRVLEDLDQEQIGVQYSFDKSRLRVVGYAGLERTETTQFLVRRRLANVSLQAPLSRTLSASLRSGLTKSRGGGPDFLTANTEARLRLALTRSVVTEVFASHFVWSEEARTDRFLGYGSAVRVDKGRTRASLQVDMVRRSLEFKQVEHRISVRFERAF